MGVCGGYLAGVARGIFLRVACEQEYGILYHEQKAHREEGHRATEYFRDTAREMRGRDGGADDARAPV